MFNIATKQQQYHTYILTDEQAQSQIEVVPERGGIITHWRIKGDELLYFDAVRFADPQMSVRGGNPVLFPICGNLPNNTYIYKDREYQLKQHGFARDLPWEVKATDIEDCASITLTLTSNELTLALYPFEFELVFTYQLRGERLKILQSFTNQSHEVMPFAAGFHPYFLATDKKQLEFNIPANHYLDHIEQKTYPFTGFDFEQEEIDVAFTSLDKHFSSIKDSDRQRQITLYYSDFYSTLVFWTVKGKDYVCLEPWSAPRNALNTKEQLSYIEPGSTYSAVVEMNCSYF